MKKYSDYQKDSAVRYLTVGEMEAIEWTKYKIVVPTIDDKNELMEAFKHIHYSDIDTDLVTVNQLAHEYIDSEVIKNSRNNIIVDATTYDKLLNNQIKMVEKAFTLEEVIMLIKAFHLDSVNGRYNDLLLEWCLEWIRDNVKGA